MKNNILKTLSAVFAFCAITLTIGCDYGFDLPEANSQQDFALPTASFTWEQDIDSFKIFRFVNTSTESLFFDWDFDGVANSNEASPLYEFSGEGTYTITLTSSDANGESATITQEVVVVEPEPPAVPDIILLNADFDKVDKNSGSACACSGWINKDLGEQGESSTGNGSDVLKFDNAEPDHIYQEFAVVPNADYIMTVVVKFDDLLFTNFPSELEFRVLAGNGYADGYVPTYYDDTTVIPQEGFGYTDIAVVELTENNLLTEVLSNPLDDSYIEYKFNFNAGANESAALFVRGIGNSDPPEDPADFARWGFNSGDEEIRIDFVEITAVQ